MMLQFLVLLADEIEKKTKEKIIERFSLCSKDVLCV